jgi:hypothetical protein
LFACSSFVEAFEIKISLPATATRRGPYLDFLIAVHFPPEREAVYLSGLFV